MKKMFSVRQITALLCVVLVFALSACSSNSDSDDDDPSSSNSSSSNSSSSNGAQRTALYWDSQKDDFAGKAVWTANTIEEKVLLGYEGDSWGEGFIDSFSWKITAPYGIEERSIYAKNYSINKANYTLTASLDGYDQYNGKSEVLDFLYKWAYIQGAKVTVTANFSTGESIVIATQDGFEHDGNYISKYSFETSTLINYKPNNSVTFENRVQIQSYNINKVTSAVAYTYADDNCSQLTGTYSLSINWTDSEFLRKYAQYAGDMTTYTDFSPSLSKNDVVSGRLKVVINFLSCGQEEYVLWW